METPPTTVTAAAQLVHDPAVAEMQQFRVFLRPATTATPMPAVAATPIAPGLDQAQRAATAITVRKQNSVMMEPPTAAARVTVIAVRPVLLPSAVMVKSAPRQNSAMMATPMLAAVVMRIVRELAPVQPAGMELFVPNSKPATMETKPIAMVATIPVTGSITFAATVFSNAPKSVTTATPRMMEMAAAPPAPEREVVVTALSNLCSKPVMMAIPTHAVAAMLIVPVLAQAPPVVMVNIVPRLNFAMMVVPIAVGTATPIVREPV